MQADGHPTEGDPSRAAVSGETAAGAVSAIPDPDISRFSWLKPDFATAAIFLTLALLAFFTLVEEFGYAIGCLLSLGCAGPAPALINILYVPYLVLVAPWWVFVTDVLPGVLTPLFYARAVIPSSGVGFWCAAVYLYFVSKLVLRLFWGKASRGLRVMWKIWAVLGIMAWICSLGFLALKAGLSPTSLVSQIVPSFTIDPPPLTQEHYYDSLHQLELYTSVSPAAVLISGNLDGFVPEGEPTSTDSNFDRKGFTPAIIYSLKYKNPTSEYAECSVNITQLASLNDAESYMSSTIYAQGASASTYYGSTVYGGGSSWFWLSSAKLVSIACSDIGQGFTHAQMLQAYLAKYPSDLSGGNVGNAGPAEEHIIMSAGAYSLEFDPQVSSLSDPTRTNYNGVYNYSTPSTTIEGVANVSVEVYADSSSAKGDFAILQGRLGSSTAIFGNQVYYDGGGAQAAARWISSSTIIALYMKENSSTPSAESSDLLKAYLEKYPSDLAKVQ